jgi:receptor protein-tyrosine kinase
VNLRDALAALRASWWLPLVGLVVGGAVALLVGQQQTPMYTSHLQMFVSTTDATTTAAIFQGSQFSQQRAVSYAELLRSRDLAERVIDELGLDKTPEELIAQIAADAVTDTVVIRASVTDASPREAQRIAEAVGSEFAGLVAELERSAPEAQAPVRVSVVGAPELPREADGERVAEGVVVGLLLGALIGCGAAVLRRRMDRSVRGSEDAAASAGAPVLGAIALDEGLAARHLYDRAGSIRVAEDYRQLRTNLQFLDGKEPPKAVLVTSAVPSEGKTTVVLNVAAAMAETGRRVVVVEADLRSPRIASHLGLAADAGLIDVLAGKAALDDVLQPHGDSSVTILPAGQIPQKSGELLASGRMVTLLAQLREEHDFVLVDAPPLLPVADSRGLAVMVDGVLLTVRYGSTRRDLVAQAAAALQRVGATVLGVVLNMVPPKAEIAATYGYRHRPGDAVDNPAGK